MQLRPHRQVAKSVGVVRHRRMSISSRPRSPYPSSPSSNFSLSHTSAQRVSDARSGGSSNVSSSSFRRRTALDASPLALPRADESTYLAILVMRQRPRTSFQTSTCRSRHSSNNDQTQRLSGRTSLRSSCRLSSPPLTCWVPASCQSLRCTRTFSPGLSLATRRRTSGTSSAFNMCSRLLTWPASPRRHRPSSLSPVPWDDLRRCRCSQHNTARPTRHCSHQRRRRYHMRISEAYHASTSLARRPLDPSSTQCRQRRLHPHATPLPHHQRLIQTPSTVSARQPQRWTFQSRQYLLAPSLATPPNLCPQTCNTANEPTVAREP